MSSHWKKFISYLVLALVVYVLIYAAMLGYLRMAASDVSNFCEQLEQGMSIIEIQTRAQASGFEVTSSNINDSQSNLLFISMPSASSASCQALITNGVLDDKKFILSVF